VKASIFSVLAEDEEGTDEADDDAEPANAAPAAPSTAPAGTRNPPIRTKHEGAAARPATTAAPKPELAAAGASQEPSSLQSTLNLHQEEVARFKGTDKNIVEGEDLDVPTWMRMRQKVRR
jgi:cell division protein FtsZ